MVTIRAQRKPTFLELVQYTGDNADEVRHFVGNVPFAHTGLALLGEVRSGNPGAQVQAGFVTKAELEAMGSPVIPDALLWDGTHATWTGIMEGDWVATPDRESHIFLPMPDALLREGYDVVEP